ncbi:hypothetical protein BJ741DRAFT_634377 [Chytriomyces cf. hyalinus JEL632]|nr:hypothetical protein BJ741DRAFT_634377 [Chytriomyces cf. hyalinus JEL632]
MTANQFDGFAFQRAIAECSAKQGPKTHLAVFDFDSTLFRSPNPSTDLWASNLRGSIISDCAWFLEPRTLAASHIPEVPDQSWWDQRVIERVRELRTGNSANGNLVIVLTGRRRDVFYDRVEELCKGLEERLGHGSLFDIILLKEHENQSGTKRIESTLEFKLAVLTSILQEFPDIRSIEMWDDRKKHLDTFSKALKPLKAKRRITDYSLEHVVHDPLLAKTIHETLEHAMVMELIGKYNANILASQEVLHAEGTEKILNMDAAEFNPFAPSLISEELSIASLSLASSTPSDPVTSSKPAKSVTVAQRNSNSSSPTIINVTEYVQYTGIFLSSESHESVLKRIPMPEAGKYTVKAHHVTICLGQAPPEILDPLGGLGATVKLLAVAVGNTIPADKTAYGVVAVRVELAENPALLDGAGTAIQLTTNETPHCTIYVGVGAKAMDSNLITEWTTLDPPIPLQGIISEKKVTGKKVTTVATPQKPAEVSIGAFVKKHHSYLQGREIGEVVLTVQAWMATEQIENASHNAVQIEQYVAELKLREPI